MSETSSCNKSSARTEAAFREVIWSPDDRDVVAKCLEVELDDAGITTTRTHRGESVTIRIPYGGTSLWDALVGKPQSIDWRIRKQDRGTLIERLIVYQAPVRRSLECLYLGTLFVLLLVSSLPLITWLQSLFPWDRHTGATTNLILIIVFISLAHWIASSRARAWKPIHDLDSRIVEAGVRYRVLKSRNSGSPRLSSWLWNIGFFLFAFVGLASTLIAHGALHPGRVPGLLSPMFISILGMFVSGVLFIEWFKSAAFDETVRGSIWIVDVGVRIMVFGLCVFPYGVLQSLETAAFVHNDTLVIVAGALLWLAGLGILLLIDRFLRTWLPSFEDFQAALGMDLGRWTAIPRSRNLRNLGLGTFHVSLGLMFWFVSWRCLSSALSGRGTAGGFVVASLGLVPLVIHVLLISRHVLARHPTQVERDSLPARLQQWAKKQGLPKHRVPDLGIVPRARWVARYVIEQVFPWRDIILVSERAKKTLTQEEIEGVLAHELGHVILHRRVLVKELFGSFLLWTSPGSLGVWSNFARREMEADKLASEYSQMTFGSVSPLERALSKGSLFENGTSNAEIAVGGSSFLTVRNWCKEEGEFSLPRRLWNLMHRGYDRSFVLYMHPSFSERVRGFQHAIATMELPEQP